jgi:hypothetical protein
VLLRLLTAVLSNASSHTPEELLRGPLVLAASNTFRNLTRELSARLLSCIIGRNILHATTTRCLTVPSPEVNAWTASVNLASDTLPPNQLKAVKS